MSGSSLARSVQRVPCTRCNKQLFNGGIAVTRPTCRGSPRGHERALHSSTSSWRPTTQQLHPSPSGSSSEHSVRPPSTQFTSHTLRSIRSVLQRPPNHSPTACPEHTVQHTRIPSEAAVLIPLMNINGKPCVLLEKRSEKLRVHAGEVSFPGGKADPTDETLAAAALREAHEELGLPQDHVEILGLLDPPEYSLGNKARVWAFVGFVHDKPFNPVEAAVSSRNTHQPLSSLHLGRLDPSPSEVSALIPLPLSILVEGHRRSMHFFRMDPGKPYWKYTVGDLVLPTGEDGSGFGLVPEVPPDTRAMDLPPGERSEGGPGHASLSRDVAPRKKGRDIELWGLSGWFLHRLMSKMKWTTNPMESQES